MMAMKLRVVQTTLRRFGQLWKRLCKCLVHNRLTLILEDEFKHWDEVILENVRVVNRELVDERNHMSQRLDRLCAHQSRWVARGI